MNAVIINTGSTSVTVNTCHNVTVTESSIIIDLVATSAKPKTTASTKRRGRPAGAKAKKVTAKKTVKK